jgi:negative regulator of sigma E activity
MKFSQEQLMAYADGELDAETRLAVETAMAEDPTIAAEVARHRALRDTLRSAFAGVLEEGVPSRLIEAANSSPAKASGNAVADFAAARVTREGKPARVRWSWPEWTSIAASLLIGVIAGRALLQNETSNLVATDSGRLVATGALASALSTQIGGAAEDLGQAHVGLSFRAKDGNYCRTFALPNDASAGVACRDAGQWQIRALAQSTGTGDATNYRQAGSALPPAIVQVIETTIEGDALDAEEEAAARARDWLPR